MPGKSLQEPLKEKKFSRRFLRLRTELWINGRRAENERILRKSERETRRSDSEGNIFHSNFERNFSISPIDELFTKMSSFERKPMKSPIKSMLWAFFSFKFRKTFEKNSSRTREVAAAAPSLGKFTWRFLTIFLAVSKSSLWIEAKIKLNGKKSNNEFSSIRTKRTFSLLDQRFVLIFVRNERQKFQRFTIDFRCAKSFDQTDRCTGRDNFLREKILSFDLGSRSRGSSRIVRNANCSCAHFARVLIRTVSSSSKIWNWTFEIILLNSVRTKENSESRGGSSRIAESWFLSPF